MEKGSRRGAGVGGDELIAASSLFPSFPGISDFWMSGASDRQEQKTRGGWDTDPKRNVGGQQHSPQPCRPNTTAGQKVPCMGSAVTLVT